MIKKIFSLLYPIYEVMTDTRNKLAYIQTSNKICLWILEAVEELFKTLVINEI